VPYRQSRRDGASASATSCDVRIDERRQGDLVDHKQFPREIPGPPVRWMSSPAAVSMTKI